MDPEEWRLLPQFEWYRECVCTRLKVCFETGFLFIVKNELYA